MRKKLRKKLLKKARKNPSLSIKVVTILVGVAFITFGAIANAHDYSSTTKNQSHLENQKLHKELKPPSHNVSEIDKAQQRQEIEIKRQEKIRKEYEEKQKHITAINDFLVRQKSPVANTEIAEILYKQYKNEGTDYKVLLAITGVESGFCIADYHYNCFGYINGRKYDSFAHAFEDLVPKVSKYYADVYGTDFIALAKAYGMINWQAGSEKLDKYYNQF